MATVKTSDLSGALLDYYVARAEGVPANELAIRPAARPGDPRSPDTYCVVKVHGHRLCTQQRVDYSTNWAMTGPLLEKWLTRENQHDFHGVLYFEGFGWSVPYMACGEVTDEIAAGPTPLIAICRAVVRAAFGDEVEDLP